MPPTRAGLLNTSASLTRIATRRFACRERRVPGDGKGFDASISVHRRHRPAEPSFTPIPLEGSAYPWMETDRRRVAKLGSCTTDVERAALGEEVDAPTIQRRLYPEWCAKR